MSFVSVLRHLYLVQFVFYVFCVVLFIVFVLFCFVSNVILGEDHFSQFPFKGNQKITPAGEK